MFNKIRAKKNILNKSLTHQELFMKLSDFEKMNFAEVFDLYEKKSFAKNYTTNYRIFFQVNYKILKFFFNIS